MVLLLKKIPDSDVKQFRDIIDDPETIHNSGRIPPKVTLEWARERLATVGDLGFYKDGILVGAGCIFTNDDGHLEVGCGIGADYRKSGYAVEALTLLMEKIRNDGHTGPVYAKYAVDNPISRRVLDKKGFKEIGKSSFKSLGRGGIDVPAVEMRFDGAL